MSEFLAPTLGVQWLSKFRRNRKPNTKQETMNELLHNLLDNVITESKIKRLSIARKQMVCNQEKTLKCDCILDMSLSNKHWILNMCCLQKIWEMQHRTRTGLAKDALQKPKQSTLNEKRLFRNKEKGRWLQCDINPLILQWMQSTYPQKERVEIYQTQYGRRSWKW